MSDKQVTNEPTDYPNDKLDISSVLDFCWKIFQNEIHSFFIYAYMNIAAEICQNMRRKEWLQAGINNFSLKIYPAKTYLFKVNNINFYLQKGTQLDMISHQNTA